MLAGAIVMVTIAPAGSGVTAVAATTQSVTFSPAADAYVAESSPGTNFGSTAQLTVASSPHFRSFLLFNVSGLSGTVTDARLLLHAATSGTGIALRQAQSSTWDETSITYGNAPAFGSVLSRVNSFSSGAVVSISAAAVATTNGTYTIVLTSASTTPISFSSREAGAAVAPQLVITESGSSPSPSPSPSPTPAATPTPTPTPTPMPTPTPTPTGTGGNPIRHVVIFFQENHSFDNVLGWLCATTTRATPCDGATTGLLAGGSTTPLSQPPDVIPSGVYNPVSQATAIDAGRMDGFSRLGTCRGPAYACYSAYRPAQIPNLAALATKFTVSDRTFELSPVPSWPAHMELVAATLDGFVGTDPVYNSNQSPPPPPQGPGWGCDANEDAGWSAPGSSVVTQQPSCVPDPSLDPGAHPNGGAYRSTPVQHVDTMMDRLDAAGLTWRLYTSNRIWSICPTFADCLYTSQNAGMVPDSQFLTDAQNGRLPSFSVLLPSSGSGAPTSQHNGTSMSVGDNWIGQAVSAVENGPDWSSTVIFITYDDNGGFYDHVPPPSSETGIRVPLVIVSPWAKPGFTDSTTATYASMLAYTEHTFGLAALTTADANAYDYSSSFDYSQTPLAAVGTAPHAISVAEEQYLAAHPPDPNDPT
jgi:phospholipase C